MKISYRLIEPIQIEQIVIQCSTYDDIHETCQWCKDNNYVVSRMTHLTEISACWVIVANRKAQARR